MKKAYVKTKDGGKRPVELDETLEPQPGVRRFKQRDGSGREDWYWVANMMIEAKQNARRWSCSRHGDKEAYAQAVAQRLEWEKLKLEKKKLKAEAGNKKVTKQKAAPAAKKSSKQKAAPAAKNAPMKKAAPPAKKVAKAKVAPVTRKASQAKPKSATKKSSPKPISGAKKKTKSKAGK